MNQPKIDINHRLTCPNCQKVEGIARIWSGGNSYCGNHEEDFECGLCKCYFVVKYKAIDIEIIEEGEKKNG